MHVETLDFRPARLEDYPAIHALLAEEGLPNKDTEGWQTGRFHLAMQDRRLLACAGLELYGSDALLRSVAVNKRARRHGLGRTLVNIAERDAIAMDVRRLFLLTTTAVGYFTVLGYEPFERSQAPGPQQCSSQFSLLCPASATCMVKDLLR